MTSMFDSAVYQRKNHTPWAKMSLLAFVREMMWNDRDETISSVTITVKHRPDVSTMEWWTIRWLSCDGTMKEAASQDYQLMLWRAAEQEFMARNRINRMKRG